MRKHYKSPGIFKRWVQRFIYRSCEDYGMRVGAILPWDRTKCCQYCQKSILTDSTFCRHCGRAQDKQTEQITAVDLTQLLTQAQPTTPLPPVIAPGIGGSRGHVITTMIQSARKPGERPIHTFNRVFGGLWQKKGDAGNDHRNHPTGTL